MDSLDLDRGSFEECPVWKWNPSMDGYQPVLDYDPLPEDEHALFIRAEFLAPGGEELSGYVAGADTFYAFGIFLDQDVCMVNFNLPELVENAELRLREHLGKESFKLFPLAFATEVRFRGEENLAGALDPSTRNRQPRNST